MRGFSFLFPNNHKTISDILAPINDLINLESGTEEIYNILTLEFFFPEEKEINEKIAEYNAVPIKNFKNESCFLYHKRNLIKETVVTVANKKLSISDSFSHFQSKTEEEEIRLLSADNLIKFLVEKNTLKDELKFQLTNISGKTPQVRSQKVYSFSITRGDKRKTLRMAQPIETIVVCAQ